MRILLAIVLAICTSAAAKCPKLSRGQCCTTKIDPSCGIPKNCHKYIRKHCPDRKAAIFVQKLDADRRRAPSRDAARCGTAEKGYQPCTSKSIANKLFSACCQLYVPEECHFMCTYETDQSKTRNMLIDLVKEGKCNLKYLSSILYCASQNRDNRKCCVDLDLNAPQLQVGSRCLRMCDPSGMAIDRITKEDVTCLYNWNVIMYCHHSGIREM